MNLHRDKDALAVLFPPNPFDPNTVPEEPLKEFLEPVVGNWLLVLEFVVNNIESSLTYCPQPGDIVRRDVYAYTPSEQRFPTAYRL